MPQRVKIAAARADYRSIGLSSGREMAMGRIGRMQKDRIISMVIPILVSIVILVLVLAVIALFHTSYLVFKDPEQSGYPKVAPLLTVVVASSGVLIAILAFSRDREKLVREQEETRSRIFLEQAKVGLDEVLELLKDQNNTRFIWIRAADVLLESTDLGKKIKNPEYANAYRIYENKIRNELYRRLTLGNGETQQRLPLPPQFFYGITNWNRSISLDEAAKEASAPAVVAQLSENAVVPIPTNTDLWPASVVAVFDFLEGGGTDRDNPLSRVEVWDNGWEDSYGPSQGARRYVCHRRQHCLFGGEVRERASTPA